MLNRPMAMPKWKFYIYSILDRVFSLSFWKSFFKGLFLVVGVFATVAIFYLAMVLFGEDELQREHFDNKIQQNTPYNKANNLPNYKTNFIHIKIISEVR